ncbi:phosphoribulokinase [Natronocella acetinitrilica]|uniref:phosphoribulokinase n=1 Tax=Natronocella acetinitrilica TaxID=414046 RepID=A0AAE3G3W2_9GAMM|nr:phosphoribulokinase [Natronocella acetinitrilica]MCP1674708.1 phosphoribulokinase [Natronocella acetinitrilica]
MNESIGGYLAGRVDLREQLQHAERPIMLAVAGDSGSGKTTYTHGIRRLIGNDMVTSIALDGYHLEDRAQRRISGRLPLDPSANNLELMHQHLSALRRGEAVEIPIYNHSTGCFDSPQIVRPAPVVVVEGLHALYDQNLPLFDFTLFVDSDRDVKWRWKFERDVYFRGHNPSELENEIQRRDDAYKQWIDFQKTSADVVIKIHDSHLSALAHQHFDGSLPENCYHMEIIVSPTDLPLPALNLPVNLNGLTQLDAQPFMLASVPSSYWGRKVNVIHVDGIMPSEAMQRLEDEIMELTGISAEVERRSLIEASQNSTMRFTQSLVAWPFLGRIWSLLAESHPDGNEEFDI